MSAQTKEVWLASADEELWTSAEEYGSRDEAIKTAPVDLGLEPGQRFWTGLRHAPVLPILSSWRAIEEVFYAALEDAPDECGEHWLEGLPKEVEEDLSRRLTEAFAAWVKEHKLEPNWFTVRDVKEHAAP